jgi:hypothetical protein
MTYRPAGIPAEHIFVLDLVPVRLHPTEELIESYDRILFRFRSISLPNEILYLLAEIAIRFEDGNTVT